MASDQGLIWGLNYIFRALNGFAGFFLGGQRLAPDAGSLVSPFTGRSQLLQLAGIFDGPAVISPLQFGQRLIIGQLRRKRIGVPFPVLLGESKHLPVIAGKISRP